jgi:uncharacterized protein with FMN-binding domain
MVSFCLVIVLAFYSLLNNASLSVSHASVPQQTVAEMTDATPSSSASGGPRPVFAAAKGISVPHPALKPTMPKIDAAGPIPPPTVPIIVPPPARPIANTNQTGNPCVGINNVQSQAILLSVAALQNTEVILSDFDDDASENHSRNYAPNNQQQSPTNNRKRESGDDGAPSTARSGNAGASNNSSPSATTTNPNTSAPAPETNSPNINTNKGNCPAVVNPPSAPSVNPSGSGTTTTTTTTGYKDGTYTGTAVNAGGHGNVQLQIAIAGGKITNVVFLQSPNLQNTSVIINNAAMPQLIQEAIQAQSANINIVSGATDTSQAFQQSLAAALAQA